MEMEEEEEINQENVDARSLCLICSNTSTPYAGGTPIVDDGIVASGLRQVFRHLLLKPLQDVMLLYDTVTRRSLICHKCSDTVKEIYEDHQKVSTLQVLMQHKVESLGEIIKLNVDDTNSEDLDVNKEFRGLVKQNYAEGRLPNAAVRLNLQMTTNVGGGKKRPIEEEEGENNEDKEEEHEDDTSGLNPKRIKMEPEEPSEDLPFVYICPKCEYSLTSESGEDRSLVREEFYKHYLTNHSPVLEDDVSINEEGRNCYKCTVCTFSSPIEEIPGKIQECAQEALEKLMEHIIEIHDINDDIGQETPTSLGDLVKDLDYYKCPEPDCAYVVLVSDVNGFEDFKEKSRQALAKLCNHSIFLHGFPDHLPSSSASGNSMKHPCFVEINEHHGSFKCPKCDFHLQFSLSRNEERQTALRNFNKHYVSHVSDPKKEKVPVESIKCPLCLFVTHRDIHVTTVLRYPSEQGQILVRNMNQHFMDMHRGRDIPKFATFKTCLIPFVPPSNASSSSSHVVSSISNVDVVPEVDDFEIVDIAEGNDNDHGEVRLVDGLKNRKRFQCPDCPFRVIRKGSLWTEQASAINELIDHYTKHIDIPAVLVDNRSSNTGNDVVINRTYKCTLCTTFESKDLYEEGPSAEAVSLRNLAEHYLMEHHTINGSSDDGSVEGDGGAERTEVPQTSGHARKSQAVKSKINSSELNVVSPIGVGTSSSSQKLGRTRDIRNIQQQQTSVISNEVEREPVAGSSGAVAQTETVPQDIPRRRCGRPPGRKRGRRGRKPTKVLASRYITVTAPTQPGVVKRKRGRPPKIKITIKQEPSDNVVSHAQAYEACSAVDVHVPVNSLRKTASQRFEFLKRTMQSNKNSSVSTAGGETGSEKSRFPLRIRRPRQVSQMEYPSLTKKVREKRSDALSSSNVNTKSKRPYARRQNMKNVKKRISRKEHEQDSPPVPPGGTEAEKDQAIDEETSTEPQSETSSSRKQKSPTVKKRKIGRPSLVNKSGGLGYQCPRCDFQLKVGERTTFPRDKLRQQFQRHYVVQHSLVNRKDPIYTDEVGSFYPCNCSGCDFKSYIADNVQISISMRRYLARFTLGTHNLKCHEGDGAGDLVNISSAKKLKTKPETSTSKPADTSTSTETSTSKAVVTSTSKGTEASTSKAMKKSLYSCPSCSFTTDEIPRDPAKYHTQNRKNLVCHYAKHLKYGGLDVQKTSSGTQYFKCPHCDFQSLLKLKPDEQNKYAVVRYVARLAMTEHVLSKHKNIPVTVASPLLRKTPGRKPGRRPTLRSLSVASNKSTSSSSSANKNKNNLLEGLDYFKCTEEDCSYSVNVQVTSEDPADAKMNTRTALKHLANHCIRTHNSKHDRLNDDSSKTQLQGVVQNKEGIKCFQCPKCDYSLPVSDVGVNEGNQKMLQNGYVMLLLHYKIHLYDTSVDRLPVTKLACSYCSHVEKSDSEYLPKYPSEKAKLLERKMKDHVKQAHNGMPMPVFELFKGIRTRKEHLRSRKTFRKGFSCQYCEFAPEDTGEEVELIEHLMLHYTEAHSDKTVPLIGPNEIFDDPLTETDCQNVNAARGLLTPNHGNLKAAETNGKSVELNNGDNDNENEAEPAAAAAGTELAEGDKHS